MKALTIPDSRPSMRELTRSMSATVSNLRARIDARACLTVAIVAILVFFACLGLMYVPGIVAGGLTSLICAFIAPIKQEGGAA